MQLYCTFCGKPTEAIQFDPSLCGITNDLGQHYHVAPGELTQDELFLLTHPSNTSSCCDAPVSSTPDSMSLKTWFSLKEEVRLLKGNKLAIQRRRVLEKRLKRFESGRVVLAAPQ